MKHSEIIGRGWGRGSERFFKNFFLKFLKIHNLYFSTGIKKKGFRCLKMGRFLNVDEVGKVAMSVSSGKVKIKKS